jgi:parallel beta-helix repeat protein
MKATGAITGATISDALAVRSDGVGIAVSGHDVAKTKISRVVASGNAGTGLLVRVDHDSIGAKLSDVVVTGNGSAGLELASDTAATTGAKLERVVADGNALQGINFNGRAVGAKITDTAVVGNTSHGIDATSGMTTVGIDAAKISDVVAVANDDGFILRAGSSVLRNIDAGANVGTGITLFEGAGGNTVEKNTTAANGRNGITLIDSLANVVQNNVALGNGSADLRDDSPGCDANVWTGNVMGVRSDPCVH